MLEKKKQGILKVFKQDNSTALHINTSGRGYEAVEILTCQSVELCCM